MGKREHYTLNVRVSYEDNSGNLEWWKVLVEDIVVCRCYSRELAEYLENMIRSEIGIYKRIDNFVKEITKGE